MNVAALAASMEPVARHFWGDPNPHLSNRRELRWGSHGSHSIDIEAGTWFDHEAKVGGGVIDLVGREARVKNGEAVAYLKDQLGIDVDDGRAAPLPTSEPKGRIVATYDYTDASGDLVFQVVRLDPKTFRQRRKARPGDDPTKVRDGWVWSVKGVSLVPYRLIDLLDAIHARMRIHVVEGEKDVDALWARGIPATCNPMGAGKWTDELTPHFAGARVCILPDNDEPGRDHCQKVGAALQGVAAEVTVLALPDLPPKGDASDWLQAGGDKAQLEALADFAPAWRPERPQSRYGAILWGDLDTVTVRQDWLVEDMLFVGDSGLMYGASQSGKSFLAVDLGLAIARGVPFLGKPTRRGGVVYQAGEGGRGLVKRMRAYRQHHQVTASDLPFILLPQKVDLFARDGDADGLLSEILDWRAALPVPLQLVVIDTFATASPGANENAHEDVSRLLHFGERVQREARCAVLWVHHKNASGEKPRGHTSLYANADTALEVIRDDDHPKERTLRVAKVKDGDDGERIHFELKPIEVGAYDSGKPMTSCVVRPVEASPGASQPIRITLNTSQRLFLRLLREAIGDHGGMLPANVNAPDYSRGVELRTFASLYRERADPGRSDDAVRKAIERDGDFLLSRGLIGRERPFVWITSMGLRCG